MPNRDFTFHINRIFVINNYYLKTSKTGKIGTLEKIHTYKNMKSQGMFKHTGSYFCVRHASPSLISCSSDMYSSYLSGILPPHPQLFRIFLIKPQPEPPHFQIIKLQLHIIIAVVYNIYMFSAKVRMFSVNKINYKYFNLIK